MSSNGAPKENGVQAVSDRVSMMDLAKNLVEQTQMITKYLKDNQQAEPTFLANSTTPPVNAEYEALQNGLKGNIEDLQLLVDGPRRFWRALLVQGYNLAAVQIALDFNFFDLVPVEGTIALQDLADMAGLDLDRTSRVVRLLITFRVFAEPKAGFISHSSTSIILRKDEELRCTTHYSLDEMFKGAANANVSLKAMPHESDSTHCPFMTTHGVPIFEYYKQNPDKAGRFARAMAGATRLGRSINELRDSYPWDKLTGTVVDVGGGSGHIAMRLAQTFPHLSFVVQDASNDMLGEGRTLLTDDVRGRISFVRHSFFDPQPYRRAGAFLIRQCTHNWADKDVVTMFKAMVPGLEGSAPDTPLLINDIIVPEPNTWERLAERDIREIDMIMLVCFGAKQRTLAEFRQLLAEADVRFEISKVRAMGALGLLEIYLRR